MTIRQQTDGQERHRIGLVVIGRNEGQRLRRCLESVCGQGLPVVYVDSGSTDGSVEMARGKGVDVVELDASQPFTPGRARNAGLGRLRGIAPEVRFVQFVDGDCEMAGGWFRRGHEAMRQHEDAAIMSGRVRERHPEASVYARLCDIEWDAPLGEVGECGGIFLGRVKALEEVGGFNGGLIAGEEPELCLRLRRRGWKIVRIDAEMARHDAAMTHFVQWWKRGVRTGYAYTQGACLHGRGPQRYQVRRVVSLVVWALMIPVVSGVLAWPTQGWSLLGLALYPIQFVRIGFRQVRAGKSAAVAALYAGSILLAKFAQLVGLFRFAAGCVTRRRPDRSSTTQPVCCPPGNAPRRGDRRRR